MAFFEMRVQEIKVTLSPFTSSEMATIGQIVLDHIRSRIQSVTDVTDSRARPLTDNYAEQKRVGRLVALGGPRKYTGLPYRDWTLRGRTLGSLKVKYASQERVTIGPTSEESNKIIVARNRKDKMWGMSPSDGEALHAAIMATLRQSPVVRVEKMGARKKAA
jgi:hypothetical protein